MAQEESSSTDKCPVDHATRDAWLKSNRSKPVFPGIPADVAQASSTSGSGCDSNTIDQTLGPSPIRQTSKGGGWISWLWASPSPSSAPVKGRSLLSDSLGLDREISSIPRASSVDSVKPANSEKESGVSESGNWIYPSEKMFFEAMKRKGYQSDARDMKTIVPIHNAVNERAWKEIKEWEKPWGSAEKCGGPRLHSFMGLSSTMSPKARLNTLLGYTAPFDRHDWVVDRCGTKIEYIIDFYAGKSDGFGKLNFYLDVRPKLNTWEGWKTRGARLLGLA